MEAFNEHSQHEDILIMDHSKLERFTILPFIERFGVEFLLITDEFNNQKIGNVIATVNAGAYPDGIYCDELDETRTPNYFQYV